LPHSGWHYRQQLHADAEHGRWWRRDDVCHDCPGGDFQSFVSVCYDETPEAEAGEVQAGALIVMHFLKLLLMLGGSAVVTIAIIVLTMSFLLYHHTHRFVLTASRAQGTVTKMVEQSGNNYYPVYTFQDSQGNRHEIYSSWGSNPPAYKIGDTVSVIYPPNNPEQAEIDDFLHLWLFMAMLTAFGFFDLLIGLVLLGIVVVIQRGEGLRTTAKAT
jgi:hypothetical protein